MSRSERRALALLGSLALAGHLIRAIARAPDEPPGAVTLFDPSTDGDPLAHRDSIRRLTAPLGPGERIDVNRASAVELARLPGVGPALARSIVADRENRGAFGTTSDLDRVPGIGEAMIARLSPHLTLAPGPARELTPPTPLTVTPRRPSARPHGEALDINRAGVAEWQALPGIGPAKAHAIVAFRDSAGPFREVADLERVPGLSSRLIARLAGLLSVR